ncbi:MAG: hypothetical protein OFPI_44510 [Osedax symbiont Rs2]|nr:MAG: hypothetical protein OFPI_44510 [Osedax symbiont Rs2]
MQLSSITGSITAQQPNTQQNLNSSSVKAQHSAKTDALIIKTHLETDAKDNTSTQARLSSAAANSDPKAKTADDQAQAAPGSEQSQHKDDTPAASKAILEHLKRQIILVKEQIAETKQQLASAKGHAEEGNSAAADAITNMLQSQQSHLSSLMSQYSDAVQEISKKNAEQLSKSTNFVDIKV